MKTLRIPIHSFVDVITNSSSEIFVQASESTVKSVKELVDCLLKLGHGTGPGDVKTVDDYFDISLVGTEMLVTTKANVPDAVTAGRILNNLTALFSIDAEYNG